MNTEEYIRLTFVATDNLPNRSGRRIPAAEFSNLARYLVGKLAIKDHFMVIDHAWGRIVGAEVVAAKASGLTKTDKAAIAEEGYQQIRVEIAVPPDHPVLDQIDQGLASEVSITFAYSRLRCPGCDCGKDIYPSWGCPRSINSQPYLERLGVTDALEISLVVAPAVLRARMVSV